MKKSNIFWAMVLPILFLATGCGGDKYVEEDSPFKVIKSEIPHSPYQSEGSIEVTLPDFDLKTTEEWCHVAKNGTTINIDIESNIGNGSRTAQVVMTWGKTVLKVPVTQPAMILDVGNGVKELFFSQSGGTRTLAVFSNVDFDVSVPGGETWVEISKTENGGVAILVDEIPEGVNSRATMVRVSCSGKVHDIDVMQFRHPDYEQLLGKAILSFRGIDRYENEDGAIQTDTIPKKTVVEITPLDEESFTYNVNGTFNGIEVNFAMDYYSDQEGLIKVFVNQALGPHSDSDRLNITNIFLRSAAIGYNTSSPTAKLTYYFSPSTPSSSFEDKEKYVYRAKSQLTTDGILYSFYDEGSWPINSMYKQPRWLLGLCIGGQTFSTMPSSTATPTVVYEMILDAELLFPFDPSMITDVENGIF